MCLSFVSCNRTMCVLLVRMKCVNCSIFSDHWERGCSGEETVVVGLGEKSNFPMLTMCGVWASGRVRGLSGGEV